MRSLSARLQPALTRLVAASVLFAVAGAPAAMAHGPLYEPIVKKKAAPRIEVAFVLDTTGSMSGLIEGAKRKIWSIASKIAQGDPSPDLRVGLIGYRDRGDAYVTKRFDLTDNLDAIYEELQKFRADGGGDTPEHVGQALGEAVKHFSWSQGKNVLKMIFLVGDAPPQTYGDGWNYKTWAKNAINAGILVNTVRCGGMSETGRAFQEIAHLADGTFVTIDGSGGMIAVKTPFDADIATVSRDLADTSVYAGRAQARKAAEVTKASLDGMADESAADRVGYLRAKAKKEGKSVGSAGAPASAAVKDLVSESERTILAFDDSELPDPFKGLTPQQRLAKVKVLKNKRSKLEQQLVDLSKKRDAYIAKHASEKEDAFDGAVMKEVRAKAADIGVRYK